MEDRRSEGPESDLDMLRGIIVDWKEMSGDSFNEKYNRLMRDCPICKAVKYNCAILALFECKDYQPSKQVSVEELYRTYVDGLQFYLTLAGVDYPTHEDIPALAYPSYEV